MKTVTYCLPAHWASYLINGDATSFSLNDDGGDAEIAIIDNFLRDNGLGMCLYCSEEAEFRRHHDVRSEVLACDCLDYTFEKLSEADQVS